MSGQITSFERRDYPLDDGVMSAVHFGDLNTPVRLIMLHANGFNAQSYRAVLEPLGVHAIALDLRGHGFSTLPHDPSAIRNFHQFRDDVVAFVNRYVEGDFILAGHSMGACAAMLCAPIMKDRLQGYVGFDLPLMPFWMKPVFWHPDAMRILQNRLPIAVGAGRRRSVFDSVEKAFERYKGRGVFKHFSDDVLMDYLQGGLVVDGDKMRLACNPKWEQAVFPAHDHNLFKAARSLPRHNTQVVFASIGAPNTPISRERMRGIIGRKNVIREKGFRHMFPLNKPEYATGALKCALDRAELSV